MNDIKSFEQDLLNDSDIMNLIIDETFAKNLYASLCNVIWKKIDQECLFSWRKAADIVARLRNTKTGLNETYLDYYCSGGEGVVFDDIRSSLAILGWVPTLI